MLSSNKKEWTIDRTRIKPKASCWKGDMLLYGSIYDILKGIRLCWLLAVRNGRSYMSRRPQRTAQGSFSALECPRKQTSSPSLRALLTLHLYQRLHKPGTETKEWPGPTSLSYRPLGNIHWTRLDLLLQPLKELWPLILNTGLGNKKILLWP